MVHVLLMLCVFVVRIVQQ